MYLKRLEIQGFKSFADKVELEFNPGITVIVGPNGSGKSNVVDAVRWVLGEQSAKTLRGLRMDDIIFSGSSSRRPVGMAQVSLTLDNTSGIFPLDYHEVTITRRLYRSGESEYLINKVPCRMKDIHQLFMDTGVGKEGFSIIGQGKIDEILSLKAEDRRNLIEEAAGIVKYRYRKKEAERKLEDTQHSLVRINDILAELSEQLAPLKEQAEKAQLYQSWKKELDQLEISLAVQAVEENEEKEQSVLQLVQQYEYQLEEANTHYHLAVSQIENHRFAKQQLDQTISDMQQNFYDLNTELERKEHQIEMTIEKKKGIEAQIQRIGADIDGFAQQREKLLAEIKIKNEEFSQTDQDYMEMAAITEALQGEINHYKDIFSNNNLLLEEYKSGIIENLQEKARVNNELVRIDNDFNLQNRRLQQLKDKMKNIENLLATDEKEKDYLLAQQNNLKKMKEQLESEVKDLQRKMEDKLQKQYQLKKELEGKQAACQQNKSRLQVLQEMEETGEGYQQGVKVILEEMRKPSSLQGILGTVADMINVPAQMEVAIENALGGALQYIITTDDTSAQEAISYLKMKKKGRATFLPLNTVKGKSGVTKLDYPGVIGRAVDLIKFKPQFTDIMEYLLGRIWIIKDLKDAVSIGKKIGFSARMVTLEGEIVTPGGALTGGAYNKQNAGLLARKRLIKELADKVLQGEEEIKNLVKDINTLEERQKELLIRVEESKEEIHRHILSLSELDNKYVQAVRENKRNLEEKQLYIIEREEAESLQESYLHEKEKLKKELQKLSIKDEDLQQQISSIQAHLKEVAASQEELGENLNQKKVLAATLLQKKELVSKQIMDMQSRLNEINQSEKKSINDEKELAANIDKLCVERSQLEAQVNKFSQKLEILQKNVEAEKENREELQRQIIILEKDVKNKQSQMDELKNSLYLNNMKLTKIQMEIAASKEKLTEHYGYSYGEAVHHRIEIDNKRNAQRRINELKDFISELGLVNFAAITEYERVYQRREFLDKQYVDLEEAKLSLEKVIKEMDQIMVKRFKETFALVNEAFNSVFTSMFGGGCAYLELSDADNLLETGIEIIAQPPGKKPQTLSLLSGGERAMTAIALLFAILKIKPSPFCVLDEIEAALDEANVDRFSSFLKMFVAKTQFIIISHRKGTMEAADVLYGVTIEEQTGVSKLISVKLSEAV
ncbi:MAG: chromosome segregation protein SMC [Bacillota bacterium]